MARQVRIEYPGALYHVMARGDRRERIVTGDGDRAAFLRTVGEACERSGALVHAYALMDNHYHLVMETPKGNLVATMRWLQNTYARRFNTHHRKWGHLFGDRYKALVIDPEAEYLGHVIDYVHLNPVRARAVRLEDGLDSFPWSSLADYVRPPARRPQWLTTERAFRIFDCRDDAAGRRRFIERLETRVREEGTRRAGLPSPETIPGLTLQATLRRGWFFGSQSFREKLLAGMDGARRETLRKNSDGYHGEHSRDEAERRAGEILSRGCRRLNLQESDLVALPKGDPRKAAVAEIIASHTTASLDWIRRHLHMGTRGYCSRLISLRRTAAREDPNTRRERDRLAKACLAEN